MDVTSERIKEAALTHFAKDGYEGASLTSIAAEVGIKKPSIYAHYKGKDDLFLSVIEDVARDEFLFVVKFIESSAEASLGDRLYSLLVQYQERFEHNDKSRFWLRTIFFPPTHLYEEVMVYVYTYLDNLEGLMIPIFEKAILDRNIQPVGAERAAVAFIGLMDSVLVEMLYGGRERFAKRLNASWFIYWKALNPGQ